MRNQLTRLRPFLTIASAVVLSAWAASPLTATTLCLSDNPPPRCFPDREPAPPEPGLPAPTDLVVTSVRATSVQLQWTDVSESEDDNVVSYAGHEIHVGPQPLNTRVSVPVSASTPGLHIVTLNTVCGK